MALDNIEEIDQLRITTNLFVLHAKYSKIVNEDTASKYYTDLVTITEAVQLIQAQTKALETIGRKEMNNRTRAQAAETLNAKKANEIRELKALVQKLKEGL